LHKNGLNHLTEGRNFVISYSKHIHH